MKDQKVYVVCRDKKILCNSDESKDFIFIADGNSAEFHPDLNDKEYIMQIRGYGNFSLNITINGEDFKSLEQFRKAMLNNDSFEIKDRSFRVKVFKKQFYKIEVEIIKILDYEIDLYGYDEDCYIKEMILT